MLVTVTAGASCGGAVFQVLCIAKLVWEPSTLPAYTGRLLGRRHHGPKALEAAPARGLRGDVLRDG